MALSKKRELGDFQTPIELARQLVRDLWRRGPFDCVLEPSCGAGSFIRACAGLPNQPAEIIGVELQDAYLREAAESTAEAQACGMETRLIHADLFDLDLKTELSWDPEKRILVVGNPPWVTISDLGGVDRGGKVPRENIENLPGLDALTGAANFDIAEAIWLKLLLETQQWRPTIALLCKQTVVLRLLRLCRRLQLPVAEIRLTEIDAARWFGISARACFCEMDIGTQAPSAWQANVYESIAQARPTRRLGLVGDRLVNDLDAYDELRAIDGACAFTWRQGVKHDAAAVMELTRDGASGLVNKRGEVVDIEQSHRFPLAKGSDVFHGHALSREVVVTQRRLGEDTSSLRSAAPKLWTYLTSNKAVFEQRRSKIYRGKPPFSLFGIGPYTFAPYKVAVSGLHKEPRFRLFGPVESRPVLFDDTCYFLPFDDAQTGASVTELLNSDTTQRFIATLVTPGAKRPITKRLLQRIDLDVVEGLRG